LPRRRRRALQPTASDDDEADGEQPRRCTDGLP